MVGVIVWKSNGSWMLWTKDDSHFSYGMRRWEMFLASTTHSYYDNFSWFPHWLVRLLGCSNYQIFCCSFEINIAAFFFVVITRTACIKRTLWVTRQWYCFDINYLASMFKGSLSSPWLRTSQKLFHTAMKWAVWSRPPIKNPCKRKKWRMCACILHASYETVQKRKHFMLELSWIKR